MEAILRHLGHRGHRCTLLSCRFPGAAPAEDADGYRIVRGGHAFDFNLAVPFLYRRLAVRDPPDVVLDDINKIPFYSPLFVRAPVLAVVPHLMGTAVFREVNPLLATAVLVSEQPVRWVYRRCRIEAISESTRDDLVARGHVRERISVIHCGLDQAVYTVDPRVPKAAEPSLVYVGRIKRYKAVDHAIRALPLIRREVPGCTLTIVGDGDGLPALRALAAALGVGDAVRFSGFVSTAEKVRLLRSAHALVNPSMREGWALTNVEANGCGTVCVAADSPGLRDSVHDGRTGLLYPYGDVSGLAARAVTVLRDDAARVRMEAEAVAWARSLRWERCGEETLSLIDRVVAESRASRD